MLYLVATPIGNLSDITLRGLEVLKKCDYILCEDTRRSSILLQKHGIKTPLKSFHKFNEKELEDKVVADLQNGLEVALISDAGTPLISDPGEGLTRRCKQENLALTVIPGATAVIAALCLSGFSAVAFQFLGFLPKKAAALKKIFSLALNFEGTTLFFESPQRLLKTLELLIQLAPHAKVGVARELTKTFEECRTGAAKELHAHYTSHPPKGEIVLLIENRKIEQPLSPEVLDKKVLDLVKKQKISLKEAIKEVAKDHKIDKKALYKKLGTK